MYLTRFSRTYPFCLITGYSNRNKAAWRAAASAWASGCVEQSACCISCLLHLPPPLSSNSLLFLPLLPPAFCLLLLRPLASLLAIRKACEMFPNCWNFNTPSPGWAEASCGAQATLCVPRCLWSFLETGQRESERGAWREKRLNEHCACHCWQLLWTALGRWFASGLPSTGRIVCSALEDAFEALSKSFPYPPAHPLQSQPAPSPELGRQQALGPVALSTLLVQFSTQQSDLSECISCSHSVQVGKCSADSAQWAVRSTQYLVLSTQLLPVTVPSSHKPLLLVIDNLVRAERGHYQLAASEDSADSPSKKSQGNAKDTLNLSWICLYTIYIHIIDICKISV